LKKVFFLAVIVFAGSSLHAQYCGSSGGFSCTRADTSGAPGYYPSSISLPPLINNQRTATTLQFTAYDSILFGGTEVLYVYSTVIDTIENLPSGLCWTSSQDSNTFGPGQIGCIKIEGIPCALTGQYKIPSLFKLQISSSTTVYTDGDAGGYEYYLRLNNPGDAITPVDLTQTDSNPVISYGGVCGTLLPLTISFDSGGQVCNGSIVDLAPVVTGGEPPYYFSWKSTGSTLNCDTCQYPESQLAGSSTFILTVTDFNGNVTADSVSYTVTGPWHNFQIGANGPVLYCDSGTVTLAADSSTSAQFQWFVNDLAMNAASDSFYTVNNTSAAYFLQYTYPGVCQATSNIIHLSFFNTTPALVSLFGSTTLCQGGLLLLQTNYDPSIHYQWIINNSAIESYTNLDSVVQSGRTL
jgi:hypothetical protein